MISLKTFKITVSECKRSDSDVVALALHLDLKPQVGASSVEFCFVV